MMESVIVAVITGGLSLIGVVFSNLTSNKKIENQIVTAQAVTDTKIESLTEEVKKHNTFGDRITRLEAKLEVIGTGKESK